jgi:serine/threonine-protein kinase
MSPEQVRASSALDARSDIWSVGCVLYELLTGTAPFDRVSLMQACAAVLEDEPLAPHELNAQVPEGLSEIVMRCLRKDPNDRFEDVASLAEALSPFGSGRFASYATRCRAHLAGEGLGRRSTPTGYTSVQRISAPAGAPPARSITVRLESHAPLTRRVITGPGPAAKQVPVEPAPAPAVEPRRVVAAISSNEDSAPFRVPRRRAVQAFAWGVPLIIGGVLATYLATAEQRARSAGTSHSPGETASDVRAASDDGADRGPAPKPRDVDNRGNKLDSLPSGSDGAAVANTAEELAQAAGSAAVLNQNEASTAAQQAERERATSRPINLNSSAKKPTTSTHSSESKTKSRTTSTRTSGAPIKPVEPAAVPARSADPDVGF